MSNGILQTGRAQVVRDGVLGSALATGPGSAVRSGTLGEFIGYSVNGLGGSCGACNSGVGIDAAGGGLSITTDMILGAALGAGVIYLYLTNQK
jgi:hypothetical protein